MPKKSGNDNDVYLPSRYTVCRVNCNSDQLFFSGCCPEQPLINVQVKKPDGSSRCPRFAKESRDMGLLAIDKLPANVDTWGARTVRGEGRYTILPPSCNRKVCR
jgi:hypothetical protein